ncbi:putative N-alpha-acetyltransferase, 35 NatC auxiliary subunit like protein [Fusarium oxysporum f. sp. albedinis]|nr:putative N-alpha-acetyltransferase, 35 NatC auxiliary subunit like protein [Fusarium oxysporum f. sp. albedinis]
MEWMDDTIVSGVDLPHSYTWHNIPQPATQLNQDIGVATLDVVVQVVTHSSSTDVPVTGWHSSWSSEIAVHCHRSS